jgi:hypothetical protein
MLAILVTRVLTWPADAAAFRSEWKRDALAAGVVLTICVMAWAIQEWDMRFATRALGWTGLMAFLLIGAAAAALIAIGLL